MNKIVGVVLILILFSISCYIRLENKTSLEIKSKKYTDSLHRLTKDSIPADSLLYWE